MPGELAKLAARPAPPTPEERGAVVALTLLFTTMAGLGAADLAADVAAGTSTAHLVFEAGVIVVGIVGLIIVVRFARERLRETQALRTHAARLDDRLSEKTAEAASWRQAAAECLQGLGRAIDQQLAAWELTAAEKEVALLLLKGLSHKEIAAVRGTSERTVRQQAHAVYGKAGLGGRHDLAAFFLEDLLQPADEAPPLSGS